MGYQSKTYSLSDDVVEVLTRLKKEQGRTLNQVLRGLFFPETTEAMPALVRAIFHAVNDDQSDVKDPEDSTTQPTAVIKNLDLEKLPTHESKNWQRGPRQKGDKSR